MALSEIVKRRRPPQGVDEHQAELEYFEATHLPEMLAAIEEGSHGELTPAVVFRICAEYIANRGLVVEITSESEAGVGYSINTHWKGKTPAETLLKLAAFSPIQQRRYLRKTLRVMEWGKKKK